MVGKLSALAAANAQQQAVNLPKNNYQFFISLKYIN